MLHELINNPDMYVIVTFKDLEKFIMFYGCVMFLAILIAEFIANTIHKIICKIKKKLNK